MHCVMIYMTLKWMAAEMSVSLHGVGTFWLVDGI